MDMNLPITLTGYAILSVPLHPAFRITPTTDKSLGWPDRQLM
jgi:hypothetical protein